ncbi:MAG: hypothetical protein ACI4JB_01950 [Porcipelethomonas sp.]
MTENIMSSQEALTAVINAVEAYKTRYSLTLTKAFEAELRSSYKYAKSWYEGKSSRKYYTWNQFRAFFYNFIIGKCPELPKAMLCYLTAYYRGYDYSSNPDTGVLENLKMYVESTLDSEQEEKEELKRLEQETREIRSILKHQDILKAYEYIMPFLKLEEAGMLGNQETRGKTMLLTEMFNYGFILGKRTERERKHKQNT